MMKLTPCLAAILACVLVNDCLGDDPQMPVSIPVAPAEGKNAPSPQSDVIRVGDKIIIRVTGIPDQDKFAPQEIQIPASGEVTMPLLTRTFQAIGRSTADLAAAITRAYKDDKIYNTPTSPSFRKIGLSAWAATSAIPRGSSTRPT